MEKYEDIDIKRILEIIWSKKFLIILVILLSIILGYAYSYYYKRPMYRSSVTILLVADENKSEQELTQTDITLNSGLISTYSNIAKSTNIVSKTIENLGLDIPVKQLQNNIEAEQINKTLFLQISVKNENPEVAKTITNELAKVFTEEIKSIYNLENINIVDEAEVANRAYNINHIKDIAIFTFCGLIISIAIVMVIYFFDDTIKDENDIEKNLKIKNLGTLPIDLKNEDLIIQTNPKSHIVESIKILRTNILYSTTRKSILITSSKQNEGKSWISNNLAVALAQANKRVILVDTDLRKENNKTTIFNVEKGEGLSDFIREISDNQLENLEKSRKYIKETNIPNLHILQNGTIPPNPSELISSNNMKKIIELLKNMYDIILLDGTPCMIVSDSIALSSMIDSTILIAESKKTKINDIKKTKKSIEDVSGYISGTILNKSELQKGKYYGKGYGYYYGKEDIDENGTIKEVQEILHLDEIIELAKVKIKEELEHKNEDEYIEEISDNSDSIEEDKQMINEVRNTKIEIFKELKKYFLDFKNILFYSKKINNEVQDLKNIQINNNSQLLDKIDNIKNIDYKEDFENINENIKNINYKEDFENINENIKNINYKEDFERIDENIKNINFKEDFENINENIKNINYKEDFERIDENIKNINYEEDFEKINYAIQQFMNEIENINYEIKILKEMQINNNLELIKKVDNINYEEEFAKINEKIENIKNKQKELILKKEKNKIDNKQIRKNEDIKEKASNNIISFESLRERRKASKRVFSIGEELTYGDLERLSTCVIKLSDDEEFGIVTSN